MKLAWNAKITRREVLTQLQKTKTWQSPAH